MRIEKCPGPNKGFAPWSILCVLSLLTAIIFILPSVVFAQTYAYGISQDCDTALVESAHTVTATVTDDSGNPGVEKWVAFFIYGKNDAYEWKQTDSSGVAQYTYTGTGGVGEDTIELFNDSWETVATMVTTWTDDPQDPALLACAGSSSQSVVVGGRVTLNAKKNGAFKIALCSVDGFDVRDVDLQSIQLVGVAPWHSHYKDSRLCPDGKDGSKDLVLKFKNREIVKALENNLGELADGDEVDLGITGSLKDGTEFGGEWTAVIMKKGKKHWKKHHKKRIKKKPIKKPKKK